MSIIFIIFIIFISASACLPTALPTLGILCRFYACSSGLGDTSVLPCGSLCPQWWGCSRS